MLLKFKTNFTFHLIATVTSISWEYKFIFPDFNSFNFKCVFKKKKKPTYPIYFLRAKLNTQQENIM